jgi:hypothetical protein
MADGSDGPILNPWALSIGSEVCEPLAAFAGPIDPRDPPEVRARGPGSRSWRVGIRPSEPSEPSAGSLRWLFAAASGLTVRLTVGPRPCPDRQPARGERRRPGRAAHDPGPPGRPGPRGTGAASAASSYRGGRDRLAPTRPGRPCAPPGARPRGWVPARGGAARHARRRTGGGWPHLFRYQRS